MPGSTLGLGVKLTASDSMSGPVNAAALAIGGLTEQTRNSMRALGQLQRSAGLVATGIGAGLTGAVGLSVAQAAELEDIMLTIQQKTSFADSTIKEMQDDFLQLSAALPLSAQELAKVGVIAGQLGIQSKEGIEALAFQASQLARASDLTEETGAAAMARLSKLFDLPIEQANRLGSSMVKLANTTTANASSIVEITKRFAGMAKVVGLTAAQSNAFSATIIDAGVNAEAGGTAMTKILAAATTKTQAFAKQMGVSEARFKEMFSASAAGTLQSFFASFKGMDKFQVQKKLKDLGLTGARVQTVVFGLASQTQGLETNLRNSTRAFEEGTALQEAFEAQTRSLNAKIDTFVGSLKNVAIAIGNTLIPIVKAVVDVGTEVLAVFLAMPAPVKFLVGAVTAAAGAFFLLGGSGLLITGTMALLHVSMLEYAAAAGLTVTANGVLGVTWQVMTHQLGVLWASITGLLAPLWSWITTTWASVTAAAAGSTGFAAMGAAAMAAGAAIWTALAPILPIVLAVAAAVGVLFLAWKVLKPVVSAAFGAISALVKPVFGALDLVRQGVAEVGQAFAAIFDPIADLFREAGRLKVVFGVVLAPILVPAFALLGVLKAIAGVFRFLGSIVAGAVAAVKPIFSGLLSVFDTIREAIGSVRESLAGVFGETAGGAGILQSIGKAIGFLVTTFNPLVLVLRVVVFGLKVLANLAAGVIQGIGMLLRPIFEAVAAIGKTIRGVIDRVREGFASTAGEGGGFLKALQGVGSILFRVFSPVAWILRGIGIAFQVVAGVVEGVADAVLFVFEPVFEIVRTVRQAFGEMGSMIAGVFGSGAGGESFFAGLLAGIRQVARVAFTFLSPISWILRGIGLLFRGLAFIVKAAISVVRGILDGVLQDLGGLMGIFKSAWDDIASAVGSIVEPLTDAWNMIRAAFGGGAGEASTFLDVLGAVGKGIVQVLLFPLRILAFTLKVVFAVVGFVVKLIAKPTQLVALLIGHVVRAVVGFAESVKGMFSGGREDSPFSAMITPLSILGKLAGVLVSPFKLVGKVISWVGSLVGRLAGALGRVLAVARGVGTVLLAPFRAVASAVETVLSLVKKLADGVLGFVSGIATSVSDLAHSAAAGVSGAFTSVVEGVGGFLADAGGALASGLSSLGSMLGLAEGGIVTRPTLALVGEAGPEAVIPLGRRSAPLATFPAPAPAPAAAVGAALEGGAARPVEVARVVIPITLECDGQVLARIVREFSAEELLRGFGEPRLRFSGACPR